MNRPLTHLKRRGQRPQPLWSERGYALIAWLVVIAIISVAAWAFASRWSDQFRQQQEIDLLRIGNDLAGALKTYRLQAVGGGRSHPLELVDLLEDRRAFGTLRHLRRIELDPITRSPQWGIVRSNDGGISGVYSLSADRPLRQLPLVLEHADLPAAKRYSDWVFTPRGERP